LKILSRLSRRIIEIIIGDEVRRMWRSSVDENAMVIGHEQIQMHMN
jgi:hypothetical protein